MKLRGSVFALLACILAGCQTLFSNPIELTLEQANTNPAQYRDQLVKVCGLATRQFENVQISERRENGNWRDRAKGFGLGVSWLKSEPSTDAAEYRCITGKMYPKGGWENYDRKASGLPYDIVVGGGSSYDWRIAQLSRRRN